MALVQLADLIFGESFNDYVLERSTRLNAFAAAGVAVRDPAIDEAADGPGYVTNMPRWGRLANDEPNASSDNPADIAVPKKIGTSKEIARKLFRNQGWSAADLAAAMIAEDPMDVIAAQIGDYWAGVNQTTIIKMCLGILADNVANDGGDMLYDIANDDALVGGAVPATELFSAEAVVMASQTLGDAKTNLRAIAVHSAVHARMQLIGLLVDQFDPEVDDVPYQTFLGLRVIVDDDMPAVAGVNRITYTSILFGGAVFGTGLGQPKTPTEVERVAAQGNGEGVETLWNRRHEIIHPRGFSIKGTALSAAATPNYATMASAAMWDRTDTRKLIPMAFIQTNG